MTYFSKYKGVVCTLLALWLCYTSVAPAFANSFTDRRITVSQKLFRALLVAKLDYQKNITQNGILYVNLLYSSDYISAQKMSDKLSAELTTLHNQPVVIRPISLAQYLKTSESKAIGSFITEHLNDELLQQAIEHSTQNHQILFSPFEGDVEQGVMAGLSVESKVRPYVNMQTLVQSQVELKPFFIKVSKHYEP